MSDHRGSSGAGLGRRAFLSGATASTAAAVMGPSLARGAEANGKIKLGLIGCGNRGKWLADLFEQHGGYKVAAVADYFPDRADEAGEKFGVPAERRFTTLSGYKRLLATDVDAVAVISPPLFHPEQAAAAVDAGKHVYLAKPIAVDPHGCRTVERAGQRATDNGQVFLVDFQTRANEYYAEALRRVHEENALGTLGFGEAMYHAGVPWSRQVKAIGGTVDGPEDRLKAWGMFIGLSGDIITEQNIHALDVMSWVMGEPPVRAFGTCGRRVRELPGDCHDNFQVTFEYAGNVGVSFSSRQFDGHGSKPDGIRNRMFGEKGVLETKYGGRVFIRGANRYQGGATSSIYKQGVVNNIAEFHRNITEARYENPTVAPSVRSNLVTILGRTAAYEGRLVAWDEIAGSEAKLEADRSGLKS